MSEEEEEVHCGQSNAMMVQTRTGRWGGGQGAGHVGCGSESQFSYKCNGILIKEVTCSGSHV